MPACPRPGVYVPRQTHDCDAAVLVRRHLPGFLARLEEGGHSLPEFVKKELDGFAGCGDLTEKGDALPYGKAIWTNTNPAACARPPPTAD